MFRISDDDDEWIMAPSTGDHKFLKEIYIEH